MKIFCFGNEFFEEDNLAKKIADEAEIPGVEFVKCNNPEEIFQHQSEELFILDVAQVSETTLVEDLSKIKELRLLTSHDLDLGFFLKLMENLGEKMKVKIICIPSSGDKEKIMEDIAKVIEKI